MKYRIQNVIVFTFLLLISGHTQVQIFERGLGGIVPNFGGMFQDEKIFWSGGFEYNIESRSSIGVTYSQPLEENRFDDDPLYDNETLSSFSISPYLHLEIMEPDKVFPLGVTLNVMYTYDGVSQNNDDGNLNRQFQENRFEGGPEFNGRFYIGSLDMLVPSVGYGLVYFTNTKRNASPVVTDLAGPIVSDDGFRHNFHIRAIYNHMFNEKMGLVADPRLTVQIDSDSEINIAARLKLGLVLKIR